MLPSPLPFDPLSPQISSHYNTFFLFSVLVFVRLWSRKFWSKNHSETPTLVQSWVPVSKKNFSVLDGQTQPRSLSTTSWKGELKLLLINENIYRPQDWTVLLLDRCWVNEKSRKLCQKENLPAWYFRHYLNNVNIEKSIHTVIKKRF